MLKNKKKKKKGFTLIELVIVLAVLAIIALIAIPNFTKVRNDSLEKADKRSGEQIRKITLMAVANETVKPSETYELSFNANTKALSGVKKGNAQINLTTDYPMMLKDVKKPQANNKTGYIVSVDSDGGVAVKYSGPNGATLAE